MCLLCYAIYNTYDELPPFLFSKLISMCWWVGVVRWDEKERKQYKYDVVVVVLLLLWSLFPLLFFCWRILCHQSAPMDRHHHRHSHPCLNCFVEGQDPCSWMYRQYHPLFLAVFFLVGERRRIIKIRVDLELNTHPHRLSPRRCRCHWCCCCCVIIIFIVFFPLFLINVPLVVSPSVECLLRSWSRSRSNIDRGVGVVVGVKTISLAPLFRWADTIFFILLSH